MKAIAPEEAIEIIQEILAQGRLKKVEELVFRQCWQGQSYEDIAKDSSYDLGYIKAVGAKLWQSLSVALGAKVTKSNVQVVLHQVTKKKQVTAQNFVPTASQKDWGDASDVSTFYGRKNELTLLQQWVQQGCQLITLLGMGGMGKTALSIKLAEEVQSNFDFLQWRSLRNAPSFDEFVMKVIQFISQQKEIQLPKTIEEKTARLLHYFRQHRCLIILDNFESVLQDKNQAGQYRKNYEGYGYLLQMAGEVRHQSCILLTSREKPSEVAVLEGITASKVQSLVLSGLSPSEAQFIFTDKGCFSANHQHWQEIFTHYAGNPLALKMVASAIQDVFAGDVTELLPYLRGGKLGFADINDVLKRQFDRLSEAEIQVINWLAINREPIFLKELESDIVSGAIKKQLIGAVRSLQQRSLIERQDKKWLLQPVVLEYATTELVTTICNDILHQQHHFLRHYALVKAQSKDYIRQAQLRFILGAVIDELLLVFGSYKKIGLQLKAIVDRLREDYPLQSGYVGGNILNLLVQMQIDIRGYDFSRLTIAQAYLQDVNLRHVNFTDCEFKNSVFAQSFGGVLVVAFSPDGESLGTGNANCEVHLWRVSDRQRWLTLSGHEGWVRKMVFSPNGKILASSSEDGAVKLWSLPDGKCISTLSLGDRVYGLTFSPDGRYVVSGGDDGTIHILEVESCTKINQIKGHSAGVLSLDFSTEGRYLVSSGFDNTIRLWDWETNQCLQVITAHDNWVGGVHFSPDGKQLVSASCDRTVRIWQLPNLEGIATLEGHSGWVWKAVWSPDGQKIASCGEDQTIRIWNAISHRCLHTLQGHNSRVWSVSFSPDGEILASSSEDQTIRLWQVSNGQCIGSIQGYTNWVKSVAFSPNNQLIATGHKDCLLIWDANSGKCLRELKAHTAGLLAVTFHPSRGILVSGSEDTTIRIWNLETGDCLGNLRGHSDQVWSLNFHPKGRILASSSFDQTIKLWDLEIGELQTLTGHSDRVPVVVFHPQGHLLASGSDDQTIKLWDVGQGACINTLKGHSGRVGAIAFSPNGLILASASLDGTVKLWDVATGVCFRTLEGHSGWVMAVVFSPDGQTVISGSCDRTIKIWDVSQGICLNTLTGHTNWIWEIALSPDGTKLASASEDETIRLWCPNTGSCLTTLRGKRPYEGMQLQGAIGLTPAQKSMLSVLGAV